ncbi:hypothetical protein ACROYT_G042207 [Oculina patagonica]
MSARFNSRFAKLIVIQEYAPTNDAEDESKEEFYKLLQREVEAIPRHEVLIVMGDFNAKIGEDNEGWEMVMGQHGLGSMNKNGERLATFFGNNDLVIGGLALYASIETFVKLHGAPRMQEIRIKSTMSSSMDSDTAAYVVKDKEVKASARADKRRRLNNLAQKAETLARKNVPNCSYDLYRLTRKIAGQGRNMTTIKDKQGKRLVNEDKVSERWRENDEGVLNKPRPDIPLQEKAAEVITNIDTGDISNAEIKRAIHLLKNGKSLGMDAISAGMLKCSENDAVKQLHLLFNSIWKVQCVPEDWKKSLIVKVPKKGDLTQCDNYRGISLLPPVEAAPDIPATAATGTPITIPTPVSEVATAPEDRAAVTAPRQTTE